MELRYAWISSLFLLTFILPGDSVKVEVFYETLNEAARKFFLYQLTPQFYQAHHTHLTLGLYPFGNTIKAETHLTCPFGSVQCQANKIHACFLKAEGPVDPEIDATVITQNAITFVHCFFKNLRGDKSIDVLGEKCMPVGHEPDWTDIRACLFDEDAVTDHYAELTKEVAKEIKVDGLVVRIDGRVSENYKTNFTAEICVALGSVDGVCKHVENPKKLKVAVYYEAMNTDSAAYIVKQLAAYYHILEDVVDVDLVPFGSTQHDPKANTYKCTQGEAQCVSNKYQAMIVDMYIHNAKNGDPISGSRRAINFASCMFQSTIGNVFAALETCTTTMLKASDYKTIIEHIKSNSANLSAVFADMKAKTEKVATKGVLPRMPTVTLNAKVDYSVLDDLLGTICSQMPSHLKTKACVKRNVTVLYEPLNHKSRTFFLEQLKPVFNNLHGFINLKLLPGGRTISVPGGELTCPGSNKQHRQDHCNAMKWHACVLDYFWQYGDNYTDPVRREIFDFILCTLKNKKLQNVSDIAETCSKQYIDPKAWAIIKKDCFGKSGNSVLQSYIEETKTLIAEVEHRNFPIVFVDGTEHSEPLKAYICGLYEIQFRPEYCLNTVVPKKIKIEVYYEAQDEHSKRFITTQFAPWFPFIEEMATVHLFPAGNAHDAEHTDGSCASYDKTSTCVANKLEALVIDKYSKQSDDGDFIDGSMRTMLFLDCVSKRVNFSRDVYSTADECLAETLPNEKWFDLQTLLISHDGAAIYKTVLDATSTFKEANSLTESGFTVLPWLTLDGQKHSQRTAGDLLQTVCSKYPDEKPDECKSTQLEIYYSALDASFQKFFHDSLIPVFYSLRERVHLELFPFGVPQKNNTLNQDCAGKENVCLHNKIHACALNKFFKDEVLDEAPIVWDGKNQTLELLKCLMNGAKDAKDVTHLMETCAHHESINLETLKSCVNGAEGNKFLEQSRTKTMALFEAVNHSPWIIINGIHETSAETDLAKWLCTNMLGEKHNFCFHPSAKYVTTKRPATARPTTKKSATTKKVAATTKKPTSNKPVTVSPATKPPTISSYTLVDILIIVAVGILGILIGIGVTTLIMFQCQKASKAREAAKVA